MTKSFVTGFSRIGQKRELKFALEAFWAGKTTFSEVGRVAKELRTKHWELQKNAGIDYISVNDFSFYDGMLDAAVLFGALPKRFSNLSGETAYFAAARGNKDAVAMEMTKWFNTNYHYIVPELAEDTKFELNPQKILAEISEAKELGVKNIKLNLVGPITFLALSKALTRASRFICFRKSPHFTQNYSTLSKRMWRSFSLTSRFSSQAEAQNSQG